MSGNGLLDGLVTCANCNGPMLRHGDFYVCLYEYVDEKIGLHKIVDVMTVDESISLVFDNRWLLPLICPSCGQPFQTCEDEVDTETLQKEMLGWYLVVMIHHKYEDDENPEALDLYFAEDPKMKIDDEVLNSDAVRALSLHLDSVWQMRRPRKHHARR